MEMMWFYDILYDYGRCGFLVQSCIAYDTFVGGGVVKLEEGLQGQSCPFDDEFGRNPQCIYVYAPPWNYLHHTREGEVATRIW